MFPVVRKRAEVAVAPSGDQEDVISVPEIGFDVPFLSHFLLQDIMTLSIKFLSFGSKYQ